MPKDLVQASAVQVRSRIEKYRPVNPMFRAGLKFTLMTASRVSEVVGKSQKSEKHYGPSGIDVEVVPLQGDEFVLFRLYVLKRGVEWYRTIPIPLDPAAEP